MNLLLLYLFKASISLAIFYGCYVLVYKREAFFNFNRALLLSALLIASLLPLFNFNLISITTGLDQAPQNFLDFIQLSSVQLSEVLILSKSSISAGYSITLFLTYIYFAVVIIKIIQFLLKLKHISTFSKKYKTIIKDGIHFVLTTNELPVFSFLNKVFINEETFKNKDAKKIIEHEKIHIKQFHSFDIILAEIVCIFQWFNPFAYFIKNAIKENHEFIADQYLVSNQSHLSGYRLLLLEYASPIKTNSLTHNFSYSLLKRRLNMMKKKKSLMRFTINLIWITPVLLLVLFACSQPKIENVAIIDAIDPIEKSSDEKPDSISPQTISKEDTGELEEVFKVVEKMPEYPGGIKALMGYLSSNIKYPDEAKKDSIQGKVFVQFVVEKDGRVADVHILRGIGGGCDKEALRVISAMPNWEPGMEDGKPVRVEYNIPIKFALK